MTGCFLPRIEFDLFWKISATILLPALGPRIFRFKDTIDKKKDQLRGKIRRDNKSGLEIMLPNNDQKFLDYDFNKLLKRLLQCASISLVLTVLYFICRDVDPIFKFAYYHCILDLLSYVGLLPVAYAYYIVFKVGTLYLKTS
jgi:hypothetical protein